MSGLKDLFIKSVVEGSDNKELKVSSSDSFCGWGENEDGIEYTMFIA